MSKIPDKITEGLCCRVCGNVSPNEFEMKHEFSNFAVVECHRCKFNFIPHYYRKDIVYQQYKDANVTAAVRAGNNWLKIQRHKLRFQFIRKFVKKGKLFDLGAGWGHFMLAGKELGYDVKGIEISEQQASYCVNDLKLNVLHEDFFKMDEGEKFDLVTLWDVLEHIDRPDEILNKCRRITAQGGYIFIHVPQIDSFVSKTSGREWKMMGLDHVNYFSRKTITKVLEDNGYEVMKISSSIEIKIFIMYTLLPWIKKLRSKKKQTLKEVNYSISSAERQQYFNKVVSRPMWQLRIFVVLHNIAYNLLSFFRIGEEMVVAARKK